jgi:hypothetical protein
MRCCGAAGLRRSPVESRSTLPLESSTRLASSEIFVSGVVLPLLAGSGLEFHDRGEQELKGILAPWRLFAVTG